MFENLLNNWVTYTKGLSALELYGGALLAIAFIYFFMRLFCGCRAKRVIAYSTEGGKVIVNRSAIVELVNSACAQIEDVSKPRVRIRIRGGIPHFQIRLKLASGGRLRAVESSLQQLLRNALTNNLGIEKLGSIDVVATGFKSVRLVQSVSDDPHPPAE
ncbi:MAG: hypothetical protein GWO81_00335 [Verrucomicrobia bacterium]|nr:hypothetical protein [Verrucomicrobiota bacterium]